MAKCKICKDQRYIIENDVKVKCICVSREKLKIYLRKLRPLTPVDTIGFHVLPLGDIDSNDNLFIRWNQMDMKKINGVLAHLLVKCGVYRTYSVYHAYELIEIFLQHHPDIKSIFDIRDDVSIILCGFEEFANKRQEDIILQLLDVRRSRNLITWLFHNGTKFPWGRVSSYMQSNNFQSVTLEGGSGNSRVF